MTPQRLTHDQREQQVMADLERHFPYFAGFPLRWAKVPEGQDPPDFLAQTPAGTIGLELIEWLDGSQMGPAKGQESQRENIVRVLGENWQNEYGPQNVGLAVLMPIWNLRIVRSDESQLRQEFFRCVEEVDAAWITNPDRVGSTYYHADFSRYPTLAKYFNGIRYIGGEQHGFRWIDVEEDGGGFDPSIAVRTLEEALDKKLTLYATPEKQAHLQALGLAEFSLLVRGGINAYRYNTPGHPLCCGQPLMRRSLLRWRRAADRAVFAATNRRRLFCAACNSQRFRRAPFLPSGPDAGSNRKLTGVQSELYG